MACDCEHWVRRGDGRILTSHAETCPHYDPVGDCLKHIFALLHGIDKWAADEDGIHPDAIEGYEWARSFIGQPLPPNPDGRDDVMYKVTKLPAV